MAAVDFNLPISEILHKGTVKSHDEVAKSPGAAALVNAALPREEYVRFLMMLWHIYGYHGSFFTLLDCGTDHYRYQHHRRSP